MTEKEKNIEKEKVNVEPERIVLEDRKKLSMTGVSAVEGFSPQYIKLTAFGSKVVVVGENLKITAFNKTSGNLTAEGNFTEFKYNHKKEPLIKRLLK